MNRNDVVRQHDPYVVRDGSYAACQGVSNIIFSRTQTAQEPIAIENTEITACTHLALSSPAVI